MAPKRILQLITRADWGGAQRHLFDLATRLDPARFTVVVGCAPDGPLVDRLRTHNVPVIPIPEFRRDISPLDDIRALRILERIIVESRADLVHCHSSKAGFLGRLAARRAGVPSVFTAHGFAFGGRASGILSRLAYFSAEWLAGRFWSDAIITVSEADRQQALRWGVGRAQRLFAIHNGIDPIPFERIPDPNPVGRPPVIGTISRLVPGKGLEDLLEAAALLRQRGEYRFVIGGEGPLRRTLEERVRVLGLRNYVEFPGFIPEPAELLKRIDVFTLPSYKEGLPYNVLEALAAGRPVVATVVGGLPEIITDRENGRLVAVRDVGGLAAALREMAVGVGSWFRPERARAAVRERFHVGLMTSQVEQLYVRLLADH